MLIDRIPPERLRAIRAAAPNDLATRPDTIMSPWIVPVQILVALDHDAPVRLSRIQRCTAPARNVAVAELKQLYVPSGMPPDPLDTGPLDARDEPAASSSASAFVTSFAIAVSP
jgi:hypothetical protein